MEALVSELERTAQAARFSGVISIFRDGVPVFNKAYGYRGVRDRLPNTAATRFGIASGTKLFTALGIGVLIDQGKLSLYTVISEIDPLGKCISHYCASV